MFAQNERDDVQRRNMSSSKFWVQEVKKFQCRVSGNLGLGWINCQRIDFVRFLESIQKGYVRKSWVCSCVFRRKNVRFFIL